MRKTSLILILLIFIVVIFVVIFSGFVREPERPEMSTPISRESMIPADIIKGGPESDQLPPVLHSEGYEKPVPVLGPINTAGAEDSPFIPADRDEMYFFFTPDVRVPVEKQILDGVTGIYVSKYIDGAWRDPERVVLQRADRLALDGCTFVHGDEMLFCSAREGYTGVHWFIAEFRNERWGEWKNADFEPEYEVGELHVHEDELYYHSARDGGKGGLDIWMLTKINGEWKNPLNVEVLNSEEDEGWPYITPDGKELWLNRRYKGSPAIFKSERINGEWQKPELVISSFTGEPTLDQHGNLYFVHHYYRDGEMIEADIYVAYRK